MACRALTRRDFGPSTRRANAGRLWRRRDGDDRMQPNGDARVVVTGFGLITPIGTGVEAFWDSLKNGRGGVRGITQFDPSPLSSQIAGEVPDFDPTLFLNRKEARRMSRASQFAVGAAHLAVQDAGLTID